MLSFSVRVASTVMAGYVVLLNQDWLTFLVAHVNPVNPNPVKFPIGFFGEPKKVFLLNGSKGDEWHIPILYE